ncbi:MAG: delta-lactam-biosynthetic de-N-acetylase [Ruminococcaceae bacterium]|nr:delta-lactam-biosynthetic de-N-acetylase [Oscillospiraceae bacterium]
MTVHRRVLVFFILLAPCLFLAGMLWLQGQMQPASAPAAVPAAAADWGLSFPTEGKSPIGNATSEALAKYNACFLGDTGKKVIYLTFDCGYENGYTAPILDALKKHNAPAAFFIVGTMLDTAPDIVRRMAAEGHIVGNHTLHHPDMSAISDQTAFQKELDGLSALYREVTGEDMPMFYRPPQGKYSEENLKQACALGYKTVFWSLAYVDWYVDNQPTAQQAYAKLLPRIHDGAIVLLHSTSATNAAILDELLTKWEEMGYTFASLEELPSSDTTQSPPVMFRNEMPAADESACA